MRLRAVLSILALAALCSALPAAAAPPAACGTPDAAAAGTIEELLVPDPTEMIQLCLNPKPPGVECSDFNGVFCRYGTWNCATGCCDPYPGQFACAPICQAPT